MSDIKLVLTDVDGTIVEVLTHELSDAVRQAVVEAENKGVSVVPVTGRPYEQLKPVLVALGFDSLCVVDNGASIRDAKTGELVWSRWLPQATIAQVLEQILEFSIRIDFDPSWDDHAPDDDPSVELAKVRSDVPYVYTVVSNEHVAEVERRLSQIPGIGFRFTKMQRVYDNCSDAQITHVDANKSHGAQKLGELLGVDPKHTLAIGDGNNDIPLFENAAIKVAMGNGTPELKALADHVVASVSEDGFAEAMNRFVLDTKNTKQVN